MKIILTVHQFLPDFFTGTEILTYDTAKELQKRGHQVEVWTGFPLNREISENKDIDNYLFDGIFVQRFYHYYKRSTSLDKLWEYEYNNEIFSKYFIELLKNKRPDLVHSFHLGNLSASLIAECVKLNIPTVFTATDFWFICPKCQLLLADNSICGGPGAYSINCFAHMLNRDYLNLMPCWLFKSLIWLAEQSWFPEKRYLPLLRAVVSRTGFLKEMINRLDRVLAPTHLMKKVLLEYGLDPDKICYVPYGINLNNIEKPPLKSAGNKVRLGFIGTIAEHKGVHILLEAVRLLPKDVPVEISVYGKLEEVPEYTARIKEIAGGDGRIHFRGTFPGQEIGFVFSQLDCLVVPSVWYENTPLVIYSAQAANTPVIATNLGGMSEVIRHEINGLLFEKGDTAQLAHLIMRLCQDRNLLSTLSANAVKAKSIPAYVDELEELYSELLAEKALDMVPWRMV
ncbi:MAG: D-inositol 3-phosphate glycosyltransferase [Pelotomaculum sp. PtaU1.Bin035]|nr:MAG: D-inositol 3-phosphate glycosyltransferase [Pelotomaculum sp. PtaU1.Bin035]